jgi:hypothetical protein
MYLLFQAISSQELQTDAEGWRGHSDSQSSWLNLQHSLLDSLPDFFDPSLDTVPVLVVRPNGTLECNGEQLLDVGLEQV